PHWKQRFRREPASSVDAHRLVTEHEDLDSILSHVENRRGTHDYTVSWGGKPHQIPRDGGRPGLRSQRGWVEERLDGTVWARIAERAVQLRRCEPTVPEVKIKAQWKSGKTTTGAAGASG